MEHAADHLLDRARSGDRDAFRDLVLATQGPLRLFIAARASSHELVEEVLQATFVAAYEGLDSYRGDGPAIGWLKGIARNLLLVELRRRSRWQRVDGDQLEQVMATVRLEDAADEPDAALARLAACLERLGPRARKLIEQRYHQGRSLARLAVAFKRPQGALATVLYRLRARLRTCIEGREDTP